MHKSYIVNFKFVQNIVGTEVVLKDDVKLSIGRKYYKLVKEQYREIYQMLQYYLVFD